MGHHLAEPALRTALLRLLLLDGSGRFFAAALGGLLFLSGPAALGLDDVQPARQARQFVLMARHLAFAGDDQLFLGVQLVDALGERLLRLSDHEIEAEHLV